jgi:hypothetical protein
VRIGIAVGVGIGIGVGAGDGIGLGDGVAAGGGVGAGAAIMPEFGGMLLFGMELELEPQLISSKEKRTTRHEREGYRLRIGPLYSA